MAKFVQKIKSLWKYFSLYEKLWYGVTLALSIVFAFVFPEEDFGGVNGAWIATLFVADVVLNVTCELLISKQSKWNFVVSLGVEAVEIIVSLASFRWATLAVTVAFWIPIDVVSFVSWKRHPDEEQKEITAVKKLDGWALALVLVGIVAWTFGVGKLVEYIGAIVLPEDAETIGIIAYLDACCSAVGIANGLFILFRYREQWFAWYLYTALEIAMHIILNQWILIVLNVAFLVNTTYGFFKWTKYAQKNQSGEQNV